MQTCWGNSCCGCLSCWMAGWRWIPYYFVRLAAQSGAEIWQVTEMSARHLTVDGYRHAAVFLPVVVLTLCSGLAPGTRYLSNGAGETLPNTLLTRTLCSGRKPDLKCTSGELCSVHRARGGKTEGTNAAHSSRIMSESEIWSLRPKFHLLLFRC